MPDSRSPSFFTIAAATLATGVLAYAIYFDYKRRNDPDFRKKLKKEKKRIQKKVSKENVASPASSPLSDDTLRSALNALKNEEVPKSPEAKEEYFMNQVSMGEQMSLRGNDFALPAAIAFYRALRVYPSPVELIVIYQKTVPENIFNLIIRLTELDVSDETPSSPTRQTLEKDEETSPVRSGPPSETSETTSSQEWDKLTDLGLSDWITFYAPEQRVKDKVAGYYDKFPPAQYSVKVETREGPTGLRKVLIAGQDFKAGDVIYKENPVVTALDTDLQAAGSHCFHCLRSIDDDEPIQLTSDESVFPSTFCSSDCLHKSKSHSTSLLFTSTSPLPADFPSEIPGDESGEKRKTAQLKFTEYLKKEGRSLPELTARFVAMQVAIETQKLVEGVGKNAPPLEKGFAGAEDSDYSLADHIERLRSEEATLLTDVLEGALPGLKQFIPEDRYTVITGKIAYNSYGVCHNGGRDNKPESTARPEDEERTRTPYGTKRQVGSAFYVLSSYLQHSCQPSAQPSFGSGTSELTLLATKDIKQGDELSVAWVDVTQHPDESIAECRRRRRFELARGWRFACSCERCADEAHSLTEEEKATAAGEEPKKDESVVEAVTKYENIGEGPSAGEVEDIDA
ncbi:MAS20 protein import receptor-domain-containing protein [Cyathus striatus]|nr:MAS20 protein import receptor-domain-containing protein [Cyathus striatus]